MKLSNSAGRTTRAKGATPDMPCYAAPNFTALWTGTLAMRDVRKSESDTLSVRLTSPDSLESACTLKLQVRVVRQLQSSGWRKVMYALSAKGASPFFERKLDSILAKVEQSREIFTDLIRNKRLEFLRTSNSGLATWAKGLYVLYVALRHSGPEVFA